MMHRIRIVWTSALLISGSLPLSAHAQTGSGPKLERCLVSVKDEVQLPAQEPGLLVSLNVSEGMQVREGQLLGNIDDSERQMQKRLALIEQQAALEQAENDVNVRYAEAAAKVAEAEYLQALEANRKVRGTFPQAEVRRLKLAWQSATLQIEQSQLEQRLSVFTAKSRAADVEAAESNIRRRQLIAPVDGEVVSILKHAGEWATPGEPVLRIVRFDTLRVEGFLEAEKYDPAQIAQRPVTVDVALARGRRARFEGKIVYVSSLVQAGGQYRVWAEVANRQENGQWVLRPGSTAAMTIHLP